MTKPDKTGEPSIEEILASIRQKNAEGAEAARSADAEPVAASSDHTSSVNGSQVPREAPSALLDRLKGMEQGEVAAASSGSLNGARRSLSFDQDLADMFDEPDAGEPVSAAPKPEMRATPRLGGLPSGEVNGSHAASAASAPAVSETSGVGEASAPASAPRSSSYGFPPLTKQGGFYPRSEPQLPPMSGAIDANGSPASSDGGAAGVEAAAASSSSAPAPGPSQRFSDLGSFVPSGAPGRGVHTPRSSFGTPPLGGSGQETLSAAPEANGVARAISEADATGSASGIAPSASRDAGNLNSSDDASSGPDADQSNADPSATHALDALAIGLAASSAKAEAASLQSAPPDGVLKPVPETSVAPGGELRGAVVAQDAQASVPSSRSLEDVVADMVRPMLQKWVQDNMPRIMEKALRSEMQRSRGSGGKPPGSTS